MNPSILRLPLAARLVGLAVAAVLLFHGHPLTAQMCTSPHCVSVTPKGATASHSANTSGHQAEFTVQNVGGGTSSYLLGCSGTSCSVSQGYITLGGMQSTNVIVTYSAGSSSFTLRLTAWSDDDLNESDQGYYNVTVVAPPGAPTVTPNGATTPDRQTNTGPYREWFTVKNTGGSSETFSLSCSNSGPNVTCLEISQSSVTLAPDASQEIWADYQVGAVGEGGLQLDADGGGSVDFGWYNVPVHSYGVSVTAKGSPPVRPANTGGHSETFTVHNTGSGSNTFSFTCDDAGAVSCEGGPDPVTLGADQQTDVVQAYSVGSPGSGTLALTAAGTHASDSASHSVSVESYGVIVTALSPSTPTRGT